MGEGQPSKVFISYSWDDDSHKQWVYDFALRLRRAGLQVILDQWDLDVGDQLQYFMEWAVSESDFVVCVCTPKYKQKSDTRTGGVGFEGYIMTTEFFRNPHQRKFIPILRTGTWEQSAPVWLSGVVYDDFRGNPCPDRKYKVLSAKFKNDRISMPLEEPLVENIQREDFDFVNRKIELAALDVEKLENAYSQCVLIGAPAGYGKSRLLNRLLETMQRKSNGFANWNWRYIDMSKCGASKSAIGYFWEQVCQRPLTSEYDTERAKEAICHHILENLSVSPEDGSFCGVLLLIDAVDNLPPEDEKWLFAVFNETVTGSYMSYERGEVSFPVRLILAGRKVEAFWRRYQSWEAAAGCIYHLRSANFLSLSPFVQVHVEELVERKVHKKQRDFRIAESQIAHIAEKLLYFSGGHPGVINGILDELIGRKFRQVDDYLDSNIERVINLHIHGVVKQIFEKYDSSQEQDVKTVLVFRMVTLDILEALRSCKLIAWNEDNAHLLGFLRDNQFLHFDDKVSFYHDDILRRIIYLDFAFGGNERRAHVQAIHHCAVEYYEMLIGQASQQKSLYFSEWLFHALQLTDWSPKEVLSKWKNLLSKIHPAPILPEDMKKAIADGLQNDAEIRHVYRKFFKKEDYSMLFEEV
jgi:hypothetical protein